MWIFLIVEGHIKMENNIFYKLRGFFAIFGSNFISLSISMMITLLFPKMMTDIDYAYFQLYLFYSSFVVFGHFGIIDGLYLKYGGCYYDKLDFSMMCSQFNILTIIELVFSVVLFAIGINTLDVRKGIIICICAIALLLANLRIFYTQILLTTARLVEYARVMLLERMLFLIFSIVYLIISDFRSFYIVCSIDLISRLGSFIYVKKKLVEISWISSIRLRNAITEMKEELLIGSNLYFSNFANMMTVGIFRFMVEKQWDLLSFGKISLALSAVNAFVVLSNAASLCLFPIMRRISREYIRSVYQNLNNILGYFGVLLQCCYFPLFYALSNWLPKYVDSFIYMGLLFPLCIYDIKWMSLESTILKAERKERYILYISLLSLLLSFSFVMILVFYNSTLAELSVCLVLVYVAKHIAGFTLVNKMLMLKDSFYVELITAISICVFYIMIMKFNTFFGFVVYSLLVILIGVLSRKKILNDYRKIKETCKF
jgi:O-antigen/teichoic acid export membrane protein